MPGMLAIPCEPAVPWVAAGTTGAATAVVGWFERVSSQTTSATTTAIPLKKIERATAVALQPCCGCSGGADCVGITDSSKLQNLNPTLRPPAAAAFGESRRIRCG